MSDEQKEYTPPRQATLAECNAQHYASVRARPGLKAQAELVRAQAKSDAAKIVADAHAKADKVMSDVGVKEVPQNPATSATEPEVSPGTPTAELLKLSKKELVELSVKAGLVVKGLTKEQLAASLERAGVRLDDPAPEGHGEGEPASDEGNEQPAA